MQTRISKNANLGAALICALCLGFAWAKAGSTPVPPMNCLKPSELAKIKVGDPYRGVIEILGKPTNDNVIRPKESSVPTGRRVLYIYRQIDPNSFNAREDCYLRLWFGPDDKLLEIDFHEGRGGKPAETKQR